MLSVLDVMNDASHVIYVCSDVVKGRDGVRDALKRVRGLLCRL